MLKERLQSLPVGAGGETAEFQKVSGHVDKDAVTVKLDGGRYVGNHIRVDFNQLSATVVLGKPGDPPAAFGQLQLNQGATVGGLPILKFSSIRLDGATFEIDDLSALIGHGELVALFPTLTELARSMNGTATFRILFESLWPNVNVTAHIAKGDVTGTLLPDRGVKVNVPFTGTLAPSLAQNGNGADMQLLRVVGQRLWVWETIEIAWPPPDPLVVPIDLGPDATVVGLDDIDLTLQVTPVTVLIPGAGELHLEAGSKVNITTSGSTANGLAVTLGVDPTSARTLLWDTFDLAAAGVRIDQGVDLQVEFIGLAVGKVTGTIASGSIDTATLGVVGTK